MRGPGFVARFIYMNKLKLCSQGVHNLGGNAEGKHVFAVQRATNSGTNNVPRDIREWVANREERSMKKVHPKKGHEK